MQAPQPRQRPRQQFRRVQPRYDRLILNRIARNFEAYGHQLKRERTFEGIDEHSPLLNDRRFRSGFGCSSIVCAKAWLLLVHDWEDRPRGLTKIRFLWALSLLKSYNTENNMSGDCGCDEKTFRYWCWLIIQELADRVPEIVSTLIIFLFLQITSICLNSSFFFYLQFSIDCLGKPIRQWYW